MKRLTSVRPASIASEPSITKCGSVPGKSVLYTTAFIACILMSVVPLQRSANVSLLAAMPISKFLTLAGSWLPVDFHVVRNVHESMLITANGEFLLCMIGAFVCYGLFAYTIGSKLNAEAQTPFLLLIIGAGILIAGLIFFFTPALSSRDIFAYADYGRTIVVYHSNPYFVPTLLSSPHDPLTILDEWSYAGTAYGPLWFYLCSLLAVLAGASPLHYIFAFRVLALATHLLNALLVIGILHANGRSQRTLALGALLYGYNPLVLLETCLDAHNDALMVLFMLLGIWLAVRVEHKNLLHPKGYIPPLLALTMAALIKFTAAPLIIFFIALLVRKMLFSSQDATRSLPYRATLHWWTSIQTVCIASSICGITILLFYVPFWIGHSITDITHSFAVAPSSYGAENSILRVFVEWIKHNGFPARTSWLYRPVHLFSLHSTWDTINKGVVVVTLAAGILLLWRVPTMQSVILAALIVLEGVLIVTPWFYSWYVLWIIALAVLLLGESNSHRSRAFIAFALVFSASVFVNYSKLYYLQVFGGWLATRYVLTIAPPILVMLLVILVAFLLQRKLSTTSLEEAV